MPQSSSRFYITSAIPYVNAKPHLGHVLEWFQADAIARYQRLLGKEVAFTCGTDENSLKNVQSAEQANLEIQNWLDQYARIFEDAFRFFNISLTHFRRGSDATHHWPGVQKIWKLCEKKGDMYRKTYTGLYCVGCESFYTPEELTADGLCPEHLKKPQSITEDNYFFKLSAYQDRIAQLITSDTLKIVSEQYKKEMLGFIAQGLEDFSVSRSTARSRGVGVPVPNDPDQVMYVWFDALSIYLTAIGWGYDQEEWQNYWPADVHVIGKGITRFHAVYWIGMLLSAGLPLPKTISVHGYLTVNGQKMSKSLGNVIDPFALVAQYGLEPIRYYLLKSIDTHSDGDFSYEKYSEIYTADLANGLGNLCSRVARLCEKNNLTNTYQATDHQTHFTQGASTPSTLGLNELHTQYHQNMQELQLSQALECVIAQITRTDEFLSIKQPWKKTTQEAVPILQEAVTSIIMISQYLQPFLPTTAKQILTHFSAPQITSLQPLFPRLS